METLTGLGKLLRDARLRLGLTQEQVAEALGVQKSEVSAFEVGRRKWPQEHISGLARVLNIAQTEMAIAAGLIEREPGQQPVKLEDPRLRRISERLAALDAAGALQEADLRHIERTLLLAELVAAGKISDELVGYVGERGGSVGLAR